MQIERLPARQIAPHGSWRQMQRAKLGRGGGSFPARNRQHRGNQQIGSVARGHARADTF
jgi:hypothetical protein